MKANHPGTGMSLHGLFLSARQRFLKKNWRAVLRGAELVMTLAPSPAMVQGEPRAGIARPIRFALKN